MQVYPWIIFTGSILSVASCSIGIDAINTLPKDSQKKTNKMYLIAILIISLLIVVYGCYDIYKHFTD